MAEAHVDSDHEHSELKPVEIRVRALETVLTHKGYVSRARTRRQLVPRPVGAARGATSPGRR
jgi:hypothetical protein